MSSAVRSYVAADMMSVDNKLSSRDLWQNFQQAVIETVVIFVLFVTVVCGRSVTSPGCLKVLRKLDILVWLVLFVGINTALKQFYPRFDDQLLNASVFSIVYMLMAPLKID